MSSNNISRNQVVIFGSLEDVMTKYGKIHLENEEMRELGISHILVRGDGYLRFVLIVDRAKMFSIISKEFDSVIEEKIPGFPGIYGYFGVNNALISKYKDLQSLKDSEEKMFTVVVEYEGPYYSINSGPFTGMILINSNYQSIKFKTVSL